MSDEIKIESLIELTQEMLELAKSGLWEEVIATENRRRNVLNDFFSDQAKLVDDAAAISVGIQTIIELDKQVMALGADKKDELALMLQNLGQGKKAVKAYSV